MRTHSGEMRILIAGFGGQGVLFLGKLIAHAGMLLGKQVTWLPSYGPEMRGGTANCAVILSDAPIGSPIVHEPDVLIAMNLPSIAAYAPRVRPGGVILYDASLIRTYSVRADVCTIALEATRLATEAGLDGLANMILSGAFLRVCMSLGEEQLQEALSLVVPAHKRNLIEANLRAIRIGETNAEEPVDLDTRDRAAQRPRKAG